MVKDADWNRFWQREQSLRFGQISWSKRRILKVLSSYAQPGKKALDAGCGSGFFTRYFCEADMDTLAVDYSEQALSLAKEKTAGRARVAQADLLAPDLKNSFDEGFDLIFSDGLFEHFTAAEQNQIMQNFIRLLNPGGVIVTFVPNRWSPWEWIRPFFMPGIDEEPFVLKELVDLNRRNGLNVVEEGGVNTLPIRYSPEKGIARRFGMLLYTVARSGGTHG